MTCRAPQFAAVLLEERTVLHIHCPGVGILVLIDEVHNIPHSVAGLEFAFDVGEGLFEERTVFRRYGDGEVDAAVAVAHIVLSLDEMLRKGGAYLS